MSDPLVVIRKPPQLPPKGKERYKLKKSGIWWTVVVGPYEYFLYKTIFKSKAKEFMDYTINSYDDGIWCERNYNYEKSLIRNLEG